MYRSEIKCQVRSKIHFFAVGVGGEIGEEEFLLPEFVGEVRRGGIRQVRILPGGDDREIYSYDKIGKELEM